jgi:hypothetical protein
MVNIVPLGMQNTAMLGEMKSLIEDLPASPADKNVICKICRRHSALSIPIQLFQGVAACF